MTWRQFTRLFLSFVVPSGDLKQQQRRNPNSTKRASSSRIIFDKKFTAKMAISCFVSPLSGRPGLLLLGHLILYFVVFRCLPLERPNRIQLLIINGTDAILDTLIRSASLPLQPPPRLSSGTSAYINVYISVYSIYTGLCTRIHCTDRRHVF